MDYGYGGQYTTTSYGAQGGAGGGGFVAGGSQEEGGQSKGYGKDTLRPVTVKQLVDAQQPHPDADFRIDESDVTQFTFVGQIRNVSQQATNYTYKIDDGTGTVEVKVWIDPEKAERQEESKAKLKENVYVRVYGRLKAFNNRRHVGAHIVRPITDFNEVQYHLLEATAAHLAITRGPPGGKGGANGSHVMQEDGYGGAGMAEDGSRLLPAGTSAAARRVYMCIKTTPQSNEGLHMQDVAARLGMDMSDVGKAGDELLNGGFIYTTVDDSTWAILDQF